MLPILWEPAEGSIQRLHIPDLATIDPLGPPAKAGVLICALRRIGLAHTELAQATCGSIRPKLLKIGALVRVSMRRVKIAMASAHPSQHVFSLAHARLCIAAS